MENQHYDTENNSFRIISITYLEGGKTKIAWPADKETLQRMHEEGHIKVLNGECTCGSPDYCDTFAHRRVRCFSVTSNRCEWFVTNDYC
jgi:hypothetical protein